MIFARHEGMTKTLTEEIIQTMAGQVFQVNLFFGITRKDLIGKDVNGMICYPQHYMCFLNGYEVPVYVFSDEPMDGIKEFVKDYMDNKKWKDKVKKYEFDPSKAFAGIENIWESKFPGVEGIKP